MIKLFLSLHGKEEEDQTKGLKTSIHIEHIFFKSPWQLCFSMIISKYLFLHNLVEENFLINI